MQKQPIKFGTLTPQGEKNVMSIKLKHNEPDALAYAYGEFQAKSGNPLVPKGQKKSELAPAYIKGYMENKIDNKINKERKKYI